ncbi:hypothetical protein ABK040_004415 [Willaertia magna]
MISPNDPLYYHNNNEDDKEKKDDNQKEIVSSPSDDNIIIEESKNKKSPLIHDENEEEPTTITTPTKPTRRKKRKTSEETTETLPFSSSSLNASSSSSMMSSSLLSSASQNFIPIHLHVFIPKQLEIDPNLIPIATFAYRKRDMIKSFSSYSSKDVSSDVQTISVELEKVHSITFRDINQHYICNIKLPPTVKNAAIKLNMCGLSVEGNNNSGIQINDKTYKVVLPEKFKQSRTLKLNISNLNHDIHVFCTFQKDDTKIGGWSLSGLFSGKDSKNANSPLYVFLEDIYQKSIHYVSNDYINNLIVSDKSFDDILGEENDSGVEDMNDDNEFLEKKVVDSEIEKNNYLIHLNRSRILLFEREIDGLVQCFPNILSNQRKCDINEYSSHKNTTSYYDVSTRPYIEEMLRFLEDKVEEINTKKRSVDETVLTNLLLLFSKIIDLSPTSDRNYSNYIPLLSLLKQFDCIILDRIYEHILNVKTDDNISTQLNKILRQSFQQGLNFLCRTFYTKGDLRKISFWLMSSPFIQQNYPKGTAKNSLYEFLVKTGSKIKAKEFKEELNAIYDRYNGRKVPLTKVQLDIILTTLFSYVLSLDEVSELFYFSTQCFVGVNVSIGEMFVDKFSDYMKEAEWDVQTEEIEKHLGEIEHRLAYNVSDIIITFLNSKQLSSSLLYEQQINLANVIHDWLKSLFSRRLTTRFYRKSPKQFELREIIQFYNTFLDNLSKSCLKQECFVIIKDSFKYNYHISNQHSNNFDKLEILLNTRYASNTQNTTMTDVLSDVAIELTQITGSSEKNLGKIIDIVKKSCETSSEDEEGYEILPTFEGIPAKVISAIIDIMKIRASAYNDVPIKAIIFNTKLWCKCFTFNYQGTSAESRFLEVINELYNWVNKIALGTATLKELQDILDEDNQENFIYLLSAANIKECVSLNTLKDLKNELDYFLRLYRQVQDFYNNYCQNDHVETKTLPAILKHIATHSNNLPFSTIKIVLNDNPFLKDLALLQFLSKCELFLKIWNETIDSVYNEEKQKRDNLNISQPQPSINNSQIVENQAVENTEQIEEDLKIMSPFNLTDLKNIIFPLVCDKWITVYNNLNLKCISFIELQNLFSEFTEEEIKKQLKMLKETCFVEADEIDGTAIKCQRIPPRDYHDIWVNTHAELVYNFLYVTKQKEYLPAIMGVLEKFKSLFSGPILQDEYYKNVQTIHQTMEMKWQTGNLFEVVELVTPAKKILENVGANELKLFNVLKDADDLLHWLLEHNDTGSFNELIRVCREVTDNAITLQSFASLIETRNYLFELIYPERGYYLDCSMFFRALRKINNGKDSGEIEKKIGEVMFIKKNLETVKQVFRDKTRSPGVSSCFQVLEIMESGQFEIDTTRLYHTSSTGLYNVEEEENEDIFSGNFVVCVFSKEKKKTLRELVDLRTTVLNTTIPDELKEKHPEIDLMIEKFSQIVNLLLSIRISLVELAKNGNLLIDQYQKVFIVKPVEKCTILLQDEEKNLSRINEDWYKNINEQREKYYFLNYFNMREIRTMLLWLENVQSNGRKLKSMLEVISNNITDEIMVTLKKLWVFRNDKDNMIVIEDEIDTQNQLMQFGQILDTLFLHSFVEERLIKFKPKTDVTMALVNNHETQHSSNIAVITCQKEQEVESVIFSLYASKSRLPKTEEILMCQSKTTLEDILLFLKRWFYSHRRKSGQQMIFTLGNIHLLSYTLQSKVVDMLKQLLFEKLDVNNNSLLVMVSGNSHQRLVNAFSNYRFDSATVLLSNEEIMEAFSQICKTDGRSVAVYRSPSAGCGKSHRILKFASENDLKLARLSLRENIEISELIQELNDKTAHEFPVVIHLDIASHVDEMANSLLFELIVIGSIRDYRAGVFHCRPSDCICIEVPNSPGNRTLARSIPICNFLPTITCEVSADSISIDLRYEIRTGGSIHVSTNHKLQFVCRFLEAYEKGVFNSPETFACFNPLDEEIFVDPLTCFEILRKYCMTEGQISYSLIQNFILFTYEFFTGIANYEFLKTLCYEEGFKETPRAMIALILEMTRDFAMRQLNYNINVQNPTMEEYANHFATLRKWEDSNHPVMVFSKDPFDYSTSGFNVISLNSRVVDTYFSQTLQNHLHENGLDIKFDFNTSLQQKGQRKTEVEGLRFLHIVDGRPLDDDYRMILEMELSEKLDKADYVLTQDNLMKMFAILLRFKSGLPVVMMGETGCGKTYLLSHLCSVLDYNLRRITLHGGHTEKDILQFMQSVVFDASIHPEATYVAFLDESNTCNCMGLIKEIVCDQLLNGEPLPKNLYIVTAINPYRLKSKEAKLLETNTQTQAAILFKGISHSNIPDPLENLVYRVHPLANSFIDHIFDFGVLPSAMEKIYIRSMLLKKIREIIKKDNEDPLNVTQPIISQEQNELIELFVNLMHFSQNHLREVLHEKSVVSLRDVARCIKVFKWFYDQQNTLFADILDIQSSGFRSFSSKKYFSRDNEKCTIHMLLALAFTFYSRLNREQRRLYLVKLHQSSGNLIHFQPKYFTELLIRYQMQLTREMAPEEGIALNEALIENIFMLFIAIVNHIPIIIVGYPASSKSLAIDLISKAMRGKASQNKKLQSLPDINIFAYQCSPLSEAKGIYQTFCSARQYAKESSSSLSVVLLDEIGLADTPKLPLKILHQELEDTENISVVAISNYSLDSSKMNRMSILYRSIPTAKDLKATAKGIIGRKQILKNYLNAIAESYLDIYTTQKIHLFFGLRDYYQCIKFLNRAMTANGGDMEKFEETLLLTILRNFGGVQRDETERILKIFSDKTGIASLVSPRLLRRPTNKELIEMNLRDSSYARHLMLLTQNNAALSLLFDYNILAMSKTLILFGSDFPEEANDNFTLSLQLQKIKLAMAEGHTCVLVHCESLYESLYDLLNQHYVVVEHRKYARLAFGSSSVTCPVDDNFRIIVIAETNDAYTKLAPPFLNRLEKHIFVREHMMTEKELSEKTYLESFVKKWLNEINNVDNNLTDVSKVFIGSHSDTLISLVQSIDDLDLQCLNDNDDEMMDLSEDTEIQTTNNYQKRIDIAIDRLCWIASPESILKLKDKVLLEKYFKQQVHTDLPSLLNQALRNRKQWTHSPDGGIQMVVMTYSPLDIEVESNIRDNVELINNGYMNSKFIQLHEMKTSTDLIREIDNFMNSNEDNESMLVLLCDPNASSVRRIRYAQYTIESKKDQYLKSPHYSQTKHIVFVVNLVRAGRSDTKFTFDFDKRWRYVFLDDISLDSSIVQYPSVQELVSSPLSKLLTTSKKFSVMDLILDNLHNSLSRIVYPFIRSSTDIKNQITTLRNILKLEGNEMEVKFADICKDKILRLIEDSKDLQHHDKDWYLDVVNNEHTLQICGTLKQALHYHISRTVYLYFAALLAFIDKFNNFTLFVKSTNQVERVFWVEFFEQYVHSKQFELLIQQLESYGHVNILNIQQQRTEHFDCHFPFSFILCSMSNSLISNGLIDSIDRVPEDELLLKLEKQYELTCPSVLNYKFQLSENEVMIDDEQSNIHIFDTNYLNNYIHDYHLMFGVKRSKLMSNPMDQLQLVQSVIMKHLSTKQKTISTVDIQVAYWVNEKRLKLYFLLLDICNNKQLIEKLLCIIAESPSNLENDLQLCNLIIDFVDPEHFIKWNNIKEIEECERWVKLITVLSESMRQLFILIEKQLLEIEVQNNMNEQLLHKWKCISFFSQFLRDLAFRRSDDDEALDVTICQNYWKELSNNQNFHNQDSLLKLLQVLTAINKKFSRQETEEDFECILCYCVPESDELRKTKCCKRYICESCASDFCERDKTKPCCWCFKEVDLTSADTYTDACGEEKNQVNEISTKERAFIHRASKLIEIFVTQYCLTTSPLKLSSTTATEDNTIDEIDISEELIRNIILYISENNELLTKHKLLKFIASNSMKSSVLRALYKLRQKVGNESDLAIIIEKELNNQLLLLYRKHQHLDFPLAVCCSQVHEDFLEEQCKKLRDVIFVLDESIKLDNLLQKVNLTKVDDKNIFSTINSIGLSRFIIKQFSQYLLNQNETKTPLEVTFIESVDKLLNANDRFLIYLLRELSSIKGITDVREMFNTHPILRKMNFIENVWKKREEVISFISDDGALADSNGFVALYNLPQTNNKVSYNHIRDAIVQIRSTSGLNDRLMKEIWNNANKAKELGKFYGLLLMVLLEHVTLRNKIDNVCTVDTLVDWFKQNNLMFVMGNVSLNPLILLLVQNRFPRFENINKDTPITVIHQLRCLIHLISVILWKSNVGGLFTNFLLHPLNLKNTFFPTMNDDITNGLEQILKVKVYTCPNNHPYVISECGRPMQLYRCPECGAEIGGTNHNLITNNREYVTGQDNTPINYCCRTVQQEQSLNDTYTTNRNLIPTELRIIRFLMNGLLFVGSTCFNNRTRDIINLQYAAVNDENEAKNFFYDHLMHDWAILLKLTGKNDEDLNALMNEVIHELLNVLSRTNIFPNSLTNKDQRILFEDTFCKHILFDNMFKQQQVLERTNRLIDNYYDRLKKNSKANDTISKDVMMKIVATTPKSIQQLLPSMLMKFENVNFQHFTNKVQQLTNEKYNLLKKFTKLSVPLHSTQYLPNIFELFSLVNKRFDRRMKREIAQETTIQRMLDEIQDVQERTNWLNAFEGFCIAWNNVFGTYVERYQCLEIPTSMKSVKMNLQQPLIYILPNEKDESILGLALAQYLVDVHNEFIQLVNEEYLQYDSKDIITISSRELNNSHIIKYTLDNDIIPFLKDHCNRPLEYQTILNDENIVIEYDYDFIQQYLLDNLFIGKSQIQTQIRMIEFVDEIRSSGAREKFIYLLNQQRNNNNQQLNDKLTLDQQELILNELIGPSKRSDRCMKCFRLIEMAIHFIQSSSNTFLSETFLNKLLVNYLTEDLMITDAKKLFGSTLSNIIQIKHLDHVWQLLESQLTFDIFANVHNNYKQQLTNNHKEVLRQCIDKLDINILLQSMQSITNYLTEAFTGTETSLKEYLGFLPLPQNLEKSESVQDALADNLGDLSWFKKYFPSNLTLAHTVEVYKWLENWKKEKQQLHV